MKKVEGVWVCVCVWGGGRVPFTSVEANHAQIDNAILLYERFWL